MHEAGLFRDFFSFKLGKTEMSCLNSFHLRKQVEGWVLPLCALAPSSSLQALLPAFFPRHAEARRKGTLMSSTKSYYEDSTFILVTVEPVISSFVNLL